DAVETMLHIIIPCTGVVALLIGIILGKGIGDLLAKFISQLSGDYWGFLAIGLICSLPFLSPLLGPVGVIVQALGSFFGVDIGKGNILPHLALSALYALNTHNVAYCIPVGLGLPEEVTKQIDIGLLFVSYSRFFTGISRNFC
ncbi:PTS sorbitol transporter subunit IIB, partial [Staphylococcus sp. MB371]